MGRVNLMIRTHGSFISGVHLQDIIRLTLEASVLPFEKVDLISNSLQSFPREFNLFMVNPNPSFLTKLISLLASPSLEEVEPMPDNLSC